MATKEKVSVKKVEDTFLVEVKMKISEGKFYALVNALENYSEKSIVGTDLWSMISRAGKDAGMTIL